MVSTREVELGGGIKGVITGGVIQKLVFTFEAKQYIVILQVFRAFFVVRDPLEVVRVDFDTLLNWGFRE